MEFITTTWKQRTRTRAPSYGGYRYLVNWKGIDG